MTRLVFLISDLQPFSSKVNHQSTQAIFLVKTIEVEGDHYHTYGMINERNKQLTFMRCFGSCPDFLIGERWLLSYKRYQRKGGSCFSIICDYYSSDSISATLMINKVNRRISPSRSISTHERYIELLSMWFEKKATVAVFSALALNDKRYFTQEIWQVFKRTGTSHLVAMSGLHVGLIMGLICRLIMGGIAFLFPTFSSQRVILIRSLLVLSVGVFLFFSVNASCSIDRSLAMYLLSSLVISLGSHWSVMSLLKYAAVILVLLDPEVVLSVGGWLSFFTVFILAQYSRKFSDLDNLWFSGGISHLLIFLFLLPVSLYFLNTEP